MGITKDNQGRLAAHDIGACSQRLYRSVAGKLKGKARAKQRARRVQRHGGYVAEHCVFREWPVVMGSYYFRQPGLPFSTRW